MQLLLEYSQRKLNITVFHSKYEIEYFKSLVIENTKFNH